MDDRELPDRNLTRDGHRRRDVIPAAIIKGIDWFIPYHVANGDRDLLRRTRLVVVFGWVLFVLAILFAGISLAMGNSASAWAHAAGAGAGLITVCLVLRKSSCFVAGNMLAAVFFCVLTAAACCVGGRGTLTLPWYAAVPVVALATAGQRSGFFWLATTLLSLGAFYGMGYRGEAFTGGPLDDRLALAFLLSLIFLDILMFSLAFLYEAAKSHALDALRASEELFRQFAVASSSGIGMGTSTGKVVFGNAAMLRIVEEESEGNFVGKSFFQYYRPEDAERLTQEILPIVLEEGQWVGEIPILSARGNLIAAEHRLFLVRDEQGKFCMLGNIITDVRQRKQTEAAMEKRLVALTRPLADTDGITFEELFNLKDIQRLQDDFARATGVSSIITRTDGTPITAPSNFTRLCHDIIRRTEKGCALCMQSDSELGCFKPDGPTVQACLSAGLLSAGAAILVGGKHIANWIIGQARDERQTEEEMRQFARNIDADEDLAVEAFREVPKMSRERYEHVAQSLYTLASQLSDMAYQNVQQARFITERKRIEAELAHARDEAEAAAKVKSEFLANMSHEIRTPMTAILGFSEMLMDDKMEPRQMEAVTTIRRNGEYLLQIINDILDLSKIEAGRLEAEYVPCSPSQILSEVISLMRVRAQEKGLPLEIRFDGTMPQSIQSDPIRLRQILINLTANAVKFTETGSVCVEARMVGAGSADPKLQVDVIDSGIGMSAEQTARLFKPFTQVDSSSTRRYGGTGLGLVISKRLAESLGGDITVRSVLGEGTTFTLTVTTGPLEGQAVLGEPDPLPSQSDRCDNREAVGIAAGCRVLLAEDGPDNQRLISLLLKKAAIDVEVSENGRDACDRALRAQDEGTPFDVILMDMQMPVMDGYDATRELRRAGYTGAIIAVTANAMSTDREKCLAAGCDSYLTKPVDRQGLISAVSEYRGLAGRRAEQAVQLGL